MSFVDDVKKLNLPAGAYAVFGSGPMVVRGIRESRDIDIVVTPQLFDELGKNPAWAKDQIRDHHPVLRKGNVEIFKTWAPDSWDIEGLIRDAEMFDGVPFVKLDAVIEWKTLRNEQKDKEDIALIESYRKAHA
ncbi:MAG TPA: hypothetical protein VMU25_00580 [Candidatus Paceibacterota bacterium]|nr:hypothetical protein [Candidatus Paceibacterota bacterium]